MRYNRSYNYDGIVEDEQTGVGTNFSFARNINLNADVNREVERFAGVNFVKTRYRFFTVVAAFRPASFGIGGRGGDQVFYDEDNPYLGDDIGWNAFVNLRPIPQLESRINIDANRFSDPRNGDDLVFDVNIFRALTTYQFTDRFLLRNISEVQQLRQDARSQLPVHLPGQRRHGVLCRVRRPLSASGPLRVRPAW